jgi:FecR protein
MKLRLPYSSRLVAFFVASILVAFTLPLFAREIQLPSSRWIQVTQIRGSVIYQGRSARVGDRLTAPGQQISTGKDSSAVLTVDSGIATINVAENTAVQVRNLSSVANGGRVTILSVPRGQARVKARRLTNSNSRLEISTPSGVAGVRGTEFGVGVGPKGKTGISTLEGAVATSAAGRTVTVNGGYSSLVFPGSPPSSPQVTKENLKYELIDLSPVGRDKIRCVCNVDPLNLVYLNDVPLEINRNGRIDAVVPRPANSDYRLVVRSPLGKQESYEIGARLLR